MSRKITEKKLVVMTHNPNKLKELAALLAPYDIEIISSGTLNLPEPEENGTSFAENAAIKAVFAAKASGLPALADDSGLEVAALGGEPGIYSARFAKDGDYMQAMSAINTRLEGNPDRGANFTCALAVAWPDGDTELFVGKVFGTLCWPPMGEHGFGYDPFFVPDGYNESFGVLGAEIKEKISHRSRAFAQFITNCF